MALKSLMPGEHDWMQQAGVPFIPPSQPAPQAIPSNPYWMQGAPQAAQNIFRNPDFALALLANSGYSPNKRSLGEIVGTSALQARDAGMQRQLQEAQLLRAQRQNLPTRVEEYEYYSKLTPEQRALYDSMRAGDGPADIQTFEYYNKLPPDQQAAFLKLQRQPTVPKIVDYNGGKAIFDPITRSITPVTTADSEAAAAAKIEGAKSEASATGKVTGETTTTAKFDLPRVESNAKQSLMLLDRLEKHPGRAMATGASSAVPMEKLPGTEARNFVTLLGQLRGKQFLEAFNMLKGGGQITEVEGAKAESAIATIQDRGQSEEAYLQAIQDLRDVINTGVENARKKAGGVSTDPLGIR